MKKSYLTCTDQFCGAGGSSIGATAAGVELRLALNHWELAIRTHNSNFPNADHDCTDVSACDPRRYVSTDILITSPECTNHTLAKGKQRKWQRQLDLFGKVTIDPAEERSRATMWDVPRFAEHHRYNLIIVENVVEARYWALWDAWLHAMDLLGYDHKCVYLNSMFAWPTPQSRDRMYVVFWRKGNRAPDLDIRPLAHCPQCGHDINAVQVWKNMTKRWGRYRKQYLYCCPDCESIVEPYYYCAANAIDWSLPAPRIGDRPKPLKDKTLKRIAAGLEKFAGQTFFFDTVHTARQDRHQDMVWPTTAPGRTQLGIPTHGMIVPPLTVNLAYTHAENNRCHSVTDPAPTQTAWQTVGLIVPPFLVSLNRSDDRTRSVGEPHPIAMPQGNPALVVPPYIVDLRGENAPKELSDALSTICASGNHHGLVVPFLTSYYGTGGASAVDEAMPTVPTVDRHALVAPPFLVSYYTRVSGIQAAVSGVNESMPTQPTWPVHYLVQPGELPAVEDCGFRMLQPHEIHRAMAFPEGYTVLGNSREKVKQLGNAVTPPVMELLIRRCVESLS